MRLDRCATGFVNLFKTFFFFLTALYLTLLSEVQFSKPETDKDIDIDVLENQLFFFFFSKVFHSNYK